MRPRSHLTMRQKQLLQILEASGGQPLSNAEIRAALGAGRAQVNRLVGGLSELGFATRTESGVVVC